LGGWTGIGILIEAEPGLNEVAWGGGIDIGLEKAEEVINVAHIATQEGAPGPVSPSHRQEEDTPKRTVLCKFTIGRKRDYFGKDTNGELVLV